MDYKNLKLIFESFKTKNEKKNNFKIQAPYKESYVREFENKFDIHLPQIFKEFITNNSKGIYNKKNHETLFEVNLRKYRKRSNKYNPDIAYKIDSRIFFGTKEMDDEENKYIETKYVHISQYVHYQPKNGIIYLTENLNPFYIVVNGNDYGKVWCDNFDGGSQLSPFFNKDNTKMNFGDFLNRIIKSHECFL